MRVRKKRDSEGSKAYAAVVCILCACVCVCVGNTCERRLQQQKLAEKVRFTGEPSSDPVESITHPWVNHLYNSSASLSFPYFFYSSRNGTQGLLQAKHVVHY